MSSYPTSQQLQELRDSFAREADYRDVPTHPVEGGAWPVERRIGIGLRIQPVPSAWTWIDPLGPRIGESRRGGNELRTALWWAQVDQELADGWPEVPDRDQLPGLTSSYQAFVKVER